MGVNRQDVLAWFLTSVGIVNSMVSGYDGSMMNGMQSLTQWQESFNYPTGAQLGLLNAIFNAGGVCGIPFAPYIADLVGRRMGIAVGSVIILVGVVLQAAAQNVGMFVGARFLIGFGLTISSTSAPILVAELAHPRHRGKIAGIYNSQYPVGGTLAAWITYGTFQMNGSAAWRIPSALQALPSVILLLCLPIMPESPRWLVDKGQVDKARAILGKLHARGDINDPLVNLEMTEIEEAIAWERENEKTSWLELVATPGNRKRMLLATSVGFFTQWSGNGLTSYYLSKILNQVGVTSTQKQLQINGGKEVQSLFVANFGGLITDRLNRRTQFIISTAGMAIAYGCLTGFTGAYNINPSSGVGIGAVAFIFIYGVTYSIAWTPLATLYPTEIMPYNIRAKGLAYETMCSQLALFFNSYVNPIGLAALGWKYYLVYCIWLPIELLVVIFFYKETKGKTLEELAVVFDGDVAAVAGNRLHINVSEGDVPPPVTPPSDLDKEEKASEEHIENAHVAALEK